MTTIHDSTVDVSFARDVPTWLLYSMRRWTVIDTPTRLGITEDAAYSGFITHPPAPWLGWRFTGRAEDGEVLVFDIRARDDKWDLIRMYR